MSNLGMFAVFIRELTARSSQPRALPPSSELGARRILDAMERGGAVGGRTAAGYLYHSARITQTIAGSKRCVDLGCGSGVQLLQVAGLNPAIQFIGIDRNPDMLEVGAKRATELGLSNVEWRVADLLSPIRLESKVDAAMSTMTLHDLPNTNALTQFVRTLRGILKPDGAIYIEDFARMRTARSIDFFVGLNAPIPPDEFAALYRCSLKAAFTRHELHAVCDGLPNTKLYSTFLVPFLIVIKTPDRILAHDERAKFQEIRTELPAAYRRDLDSLRRFFALGGLKNDPFQQQ